MVIGGLIINGDVISGNRVRLGGQSRDWGRLPPMFRSLSKRSAPSAALDWRSGSEASVSLQFDANREVAGGPVIGQVAGMGGPDRRGCPKRKLTRPAYSEELLPNLEEL